MLFGEGDGGGGPNRDILTRLELLRKTHGMPEVTWCCVVSHLRANCAAQIVHATPVEFFKEVKRQAQLRPLVQWTGELYLELHQVRLCVNTSACSCADVITGHADVTSSHEEDESRE